MKENNMNVLLGIIVIIFGLIILLAPESVFASLVMIAGVLVIIFGLMRVLGAMRDDSESKSYSITSALLSILFGIILIIYRDTTIKVLAELVGIWFLISGVSSLLFMLKSNLKGKILIRPITKIVIGLVSVFIPIIPVTFAGIIVGIILILAGVSIITTKKEEKTIYKVKVKK